MSLRRLKTQHLTTTALTSALLVLGATTLFGCSTDMETPPIDTVPSNDSDTRILSTDLAAPWSIVPLKSGSTLISERDTGNILERTSTGELRTILTVEDVSASGEGGLLGLTVAGSGEEWLYAYYTTADDNRVIRYSLTGEPGSHALDSSQIILAGIPKAGNHNGGRLAIGPDNMLYITTGDASNGEASQDVSNLAGKILRLTLDGDIPADNPFTDSPVWSYGHRNVQGIAWTPDGNMWASEFGQNTWDELNLIQAGGNYGWPVVEGTTEDNRFMNPLVQWPTSEASPSGITAVGNQVFLASLRGAQIWVVDTALLDTQQSVLYSDAPEAIGSLTDDYGRIRDVIPGPDGTIWFITNNTDGRGTPFSNDDRLIEIKLP